MDRSCRSQLLLGYIVIVTILANADAYAICGRPAFKALKVLKARDQVMAKLMKFRNPNWLWESLTTINAIQLAAPEKFFGRQKSIKAVTKLVQDSWDDLETFEFAQLAFVARSLCLNPRQLGGKDVLGAISDSLPTFLSNATDASDPDNLIFFSLMLSALCINDHPIDPRYVNGLLVLQNADGSFGQENNSQEATIFMLRPIFCLTRMRNALFNVSKVKDTVLSMRNFIISKVSRPHPHSAEVYIGPPEFTSDALTALYKTIQPGEDPNKKWRCRDVVETLGLQPLDSDEEDDLQDRLYRITARDYLDLQSCKYECLKRKDLDRIPKGYKPTCESGKPETCG